MFTNQRKMKFISIPIVMILIMNVFAINVVGVTDSNTAPIEVERTISPSGEIFVGDEITITYTITPDSIPVEAPKRKEIVIIMDTSGSMDWSLSGNRNTSYSNKRMTIAKNAVSDFIDQLGEESNIHVSYIDYSYDANVYNSSSPFINIENGSSTSRLLDYMNGRRAVGGTNIGDGLRRAYYTLKNKGVSTADKYMIFLTDGEPTHSTAKTVSSGSWWRRSYTTVYKMDDGVADGTISSNSKGLKYANDWATKYNSIGYPVNTYYIAFSTNGANKLREISSKTNESIYSVATTKDALNSVYEQIADEITKNIPIEDMYFEETFPDGIQIIDMPDGMTEGNGTVQWDVPPFEYHLNSSRTRYEADPLSFSIKVKAGTSGDFMLGNESGSENAYITYIDLDGVTRVKKNFETEEIIIYELNPPTINMSQDLDSRDKTFTLSHEGSGSMHFDGSDDYIQIGQGGNVAEWHDNLFGTSQNEWTIRAVIKPNKLTGEVSNHGIKNVFIAKASKGYNDNLEIGIDSSTNNLMLYMNNTGDDGVSITDIIGGGELTPNVQHDVIITFKEGKITVSLDGKEYTSLNWNTKRVLGEAVGSPITLGATKNRDTYYSGKINKVEFYNKALYRNDIYAGTSTGLVASYNYNNQNLDRLDDDSGNGYHSNDVNGVYLQNGSTQSISLEYKIGDDGVWQDYRLGDEILALDEPGDIKVYARAKDSAGHTSQIATKVAKVAERNYIDSVVLTSNKSEIGVRENFVVEYEFIGAEVEVSGATESEKLFGDIDIILNVPSNAIPYDLPDGLTYNSATNTIKGKIKDGRLIRQGNGKYLFDPRVIAISFKPKDTSNISIPRDSVEFEFEDVFGNGISGTSGTKVAVTVYPTTPTITEIAENEIGPDEPKPVIDQGEAAEAVIKGEADAGDTVTVKVTDKDDNSVEKDVVADENGIYEATLDLSGLEFGPMDAEATVTDDENDSRKTNEEAEKRIVVPDVELL